MTLRALLRLYPRQWRQRYGDELGALLEEEPLKAAAVVDVLRGALDAHLHPELVRPALVAATGSGGIRLVPRSPRGRVLTLVALTLVALIGWALAQPLPYVPLILPIGAHASPEDFARSQAAPGQDVRVTVEHDGLAGVLLSNASGTEQTLVTAYRASTLGWMGGSGGKSSGAPPSAERPLRAGYVSGWSADAVGTHRAFGFIAVNGVVSERVTRVVVLFADGSRDEPPIHQGAFLWFAGRWDLAAPPYRDPGERAQWEEQSFGRTPTTVIAYAADGTELARQEIHPQ